MVQSKQEAQNYQEDEIDLRALAYSLIKILIKRKLLIIALTSFVTIIAFLHTNTLVPSYKATISFISPSNSSIAYINNLSYKAETKNSIFTRFLYQLSSQDIQKLAITEGNYLTLLNTDNSPIDDVDAFVSGCIGSIEIINPSLIDESLSLIENPHLVSIEGCSSVVISEYLNSLIALANSETMSEITNLNQLIISIRLEEILRERGLLLEQAEKDRFSKIERIKEEDSQKIRQINDQIEALKIKAKRDRLNQIVRIKEEDSQKIRQINDQIDRARYKAKESRLNQIVVLTDSVKLAKSLGIKENNFQNYNALFNDNPSPDLNIAIGASAVLSKTLPEWYTYGEKALVERVEALQNRTSDDPFIPELVTLKNQLNEVQNNNVLKTLEARQDDDPFIPKLVTLKNQLNVVQNNNALKTLEARQDDSPFVAEIINLDIEKNQLESRVINMSGLNSTQLWKNASETIYPNKKRIILLAFIVSFMMSIFLAIIMGVLKLNEKTPA